MEPTAGVYKGGFPAWFVCMQLYVCVAWNSPRESLHDLHQRAYNGKLFAYIERLLGEVYFTDRLGTCHALRTRTHGDTTHMQLLRVEFLIRITHHVSRITHYASRAHGDIALIMFTQWACTHARAHQRRPLPAPLMFVPGISKGWIRP